MAAVAPSSAPPPSHRPRARINRISTDASAARRFEAAAVLVVLALAVAIVAALLIGEPRALRVMEISPAAGAADVPLDRQVIVSFSRPLDASVTPGAIVLSPRVEGLVSVAGRRAAFTPRHRLRADTTYTITVTADIRDHSGRTLADAVVSTFRTRPLAVV